MGNSKGFAIAALVIGVVSVLTAGFGLILPILAIVFGAIALTQNKKKKEEGAFGMALAGLIMGAVMLIVGFAITILPIIYYATISPVEYLPEKCTFTAGLQCQDYMMLYAQRPDMGTIKLFMENSLNRTIDIKSVRITGDTIANSGTGCSFEASNGLSNTNDITDANGKALIVDSQGTGYEVTNGEKFLVTIGPSAGCYPLNPKEKTRFNAAITYTYSGSTVEHTANGQVYVKPQQG